MAVFRVERNKGYTVMSNHHLRNRELSLKAKGLLSQMLSLLEDWDYHVRLTVGGADAASCRISDAAEADALKATCEKSQAVCISVTREKKTLAPPKLFDLTTLQREANKIYGYTAKQTLDLAQALYEKRLLTYPRTDSNFLTNDMGETAEKIVRYRKQLQGRRNPFRAAH